MTSVTIYHGNTYTSNNIDHYLVDAQEKRQSEKLIDDILYLYEIDLDDIIVDFIEYLRSSSFEFW